MDSYPFCAPERLFCLSKQMLESFNTECISLAKATFGKSILRFLPLIDKVIPTSSWSMMWTSITLSKIRSLRHINKKDSKGLGESRNRRNASGTYKRSEKQIFWKHRYHKRPQELGFDMSTIFDKEYWQKSKNYNNPEAHFNTKVLPYKTTTIPTHSWHRRTEKIKICLIR